MNHKTALLVIDVQKGLFRRPVPIHQAEKLLENINALIEYAHGRDIPVCLIQHSNKSVLVEGSEDWQLHSGLHFAEADLLIQKRQGSAFQGTSLESELEQRGIQTVVVTGLVSHGCVKATCVDAKKRGYEVVLVEDGHSNYHRQAGKLIREWNEKLRDEGIVKLWSAEMIMRKGGGDF